MIENRCFRRPSERVLRFEVLEDRRVLAVTLDLGSAVAIAPNSSPDYVNVSDDSVSYNYQSEMTLDVNPHNPLNLAGFSHRIPPADPNSNTEIDVFYSLDGGVSWNTTTINNGNDPTGFANRRFDPSIAFDADGNLYIAYGHRVVATNTDKIVVAKSINGGASFTFTTAVSESSNRELDKWHLATGPDGPNSDNQAVYVVYSDILGTIDFDIMVAGSNDGGASFDAPIQVNDDATDGLEHRRFFADPAVGPNGELYVSWVDYRISVSDTVATVYIDSDLDGLFASIDTFGTDVLVKEMEYPLDKTDVGAALTRGIHTGPVLDIDRSGGQYDGRLYLTWVDAGDGANFDNMDPSDDNSDVFLAWSDNDGAIWTLPGSVGNVEDSTGTDFLPWVDVDQVTGSVNVLYYTTDGDQATDNDDVHVRLATSVDGGATFVYANMSAFTTNENGGDPGDYREYIGLAVHGGTAHALWSSRLPERVGTSEESDSEALYASAALASVTGTNLLTVTGDDEPGSPDDVIEIRLHAVNADYVEVLVNESLQYAGLINTIDQIVVDGLGGINQYLVDPSVLALVPVVLPAPRINTVAISRDGSAGYDFHTARFDDPTTPANEDQPVTGSGNQLRTVPVGNANTVSITFDQDVLIDASDMGLIGLSAGNPAAANVPQLASGGFDYDAETFTATWTYAAPFIAHSDFYLIKLTDGVGDGAADGVTSKATGVRLDSEWVNPANISVGSTAGVSVFPSGNGTAGGDFQFVFTILPDATLDNLAEDGDLSVVLSHFNDSGTTFLEGDFNGDVETEDADLNLLLAVFNADLQALLLAVDRDGDPFSFVQDDIAWYQQNDPTNALFLAFEDFYNSFGEVDIGVAS